MKNRKTPPVGTQTSEFDIDRLEGLVEELMKPVRQEDRIKNYMSQAGLTYSTDPIDQLGAVLQALEGAGVPQKSGKLREK